MHTLIDPLLDDAPCGFVTFRDDGTILLANRTLADMLEYPRAELQGWHLQKILPPGARVFYNTHVFPILRLHGRAEEIYLALQTRSGLQIPVSFNAIRRERHGLWVTDAILTRMLQRNRFEEQLLEARRNAERADALKAKFLSMMSHDLRVPLTSIAGHADLLDAGIHGPLNADQQRSVVSMQRAARDVERMLDDILSFAQLDAGQMSLNLEPVVVHEALVRALSVVRLHADQSKLEVTIDDTPAGLRVLADRERLQQILLNVLTNAIKFTPAGGTVTLSGQRIENRVRISIRDTGIGIPAARVEQIFEAFTQLAPKGGGKPNRGVGLGLAISRDLARAMDGELTATSEEGKGSLFTLDLPAADERPSQSTPSEA